MLMEADRERWVKVGQLLLLLPPLPLMEPVSASCESGR